MSTEIQQRKTGSLDTVRSLLEASKPRLAEVMPKHLTPDRLTRVAIAAMGRTPKLLQCKPASLLNSVMQAAQLGLEPGSALGEAYLVPYKDTCQLIVGYRGLISLARRSGQIASIEAHVVHEKDRFTCRYGLDSVLQHEPDWSDNPGQPIAVYAVAKLKDGATQAEVMTKAQVDAIRQRSMASGSGPWVTDYEEMMRKTVVRRLCKYLPLSIEMAEALAVEDEAESGAMDVIDLPAAEAAPTRAETVKSKLRARTRTIEATSTPVPEPEAEPEEEEPIPFETAEEEAARLQQQAPPESGQVRAPDDTAAKQVSAPKTEVEEHHERMVAWAKANPNSPIGDLMRQFRPVSLNRATAAYNEAHGKGA